MQGAPVHVNRYITGHGRKDSGVVTHIQNGLDVPIHVTFIQRMPWYLRAYYHTLKFTLNNEAVPVQESKRIISDPF